MPTLTPEQIYVQARDASQVAAEAQNAKLLPEAKRGFDCGFAWVTIKPARGPFVAFLKAHNIGNKHSFSGGPGYGLWYSALHDIPTQSISVHEAAARAFAAVLKEHGIEASTGSRLD